MNDPTMNDRDMNDPAMNNSTKHTSPSVRRWTPVSAALGGAITMFLLTALLLIIQNARESWPFDQAPVYINSDTDTASDSHAASSGSNSPTDIDEQHNHGRVGVNVEPRWLERLEVRTEAARMEFISRSVRTVAIVIPDEEKVSHIHTRVSGWIEELHVATTGQAVEEGQALASIFSQDLYAAQIEYLAATTRGQGEQSLVQQGARQRLKVLGMNDAEIEQIRKNREARYYVTLNAPRSGVVLRRGVSAGTAVDPSTELMTIADLSHIWIIAELPESDVGLVKEGAAVSIEVPASGLPPFEATVDFLYPTLSERTRSLRVRMRVPNPERTLLPGMSGFARFSGTPRRTLTVPRDAVVDTGNMQHVFVKGEGNHFEPQPVRLGLRLAERIEILEGLEEGDQVVASGVFLIDSESRLRGSGGAGHAGHGTPREPADAPPATSSETPTSRDTQATPADNHQGHAR